MYYSLKFLYIFCIIQYYIYLSSEEEERTIIHGLDDGSYKHIDEFLSKWNTTYKRMEKTNSDLLYSKALEKEENINLESRFKSLTDDEQPVTKSSLDIETKEDLLAVFGSKSKTNVFDLISRSNFSPKDSEVSAKKEEVKSFSLTKGIINNALEKPESRAPDYNVIDKLKCNEDIVIQQRTFLIDELTFLLPYRSVMFVSCKTNILPRISIRHGSYNTTINSRKYSSYVINAKDMTPNTIFFVNNRTVKIDSLESTEQIIGSLNLYLNIKNKNHFLYPTQFSYLSLSYKQAIAEYVNTIPISQTYLIQLYTMGTLLNTSKVPSKEERSRFSTFHDLVYCSKDRKCNGDNFIGKSDTPYPFEREDDFSSLLSTILSIISSGFDKFRYRQLVSQQSQFNVGVINTGLYASDQSAFVSEGENIFGNKVQNELPHELGHTYDLPDYSGFLNPESKLIHYSLQFSLEVSQPYSNSLEYKGSMNGGDLKKGAYTRLNRFSSERVYQLMKRSKLLPPEIKNTLKTGGASLILARFEKELFLFRVNIDIIPKPVFDTTPCLTCDTTVFVYKANEKKDPNIYYIDLFLRNVVRIPNSWLNSTNFIIVKNNFTEKLFYATDDSNNMVKPFEVVNPDNYKSVPIDKDGDGNIESNLTNFWEISAIPIKFFKKVDETIEDYEKFFENTNYIQFRTRDGYWKNYFYIPKHNFNETKIILFSNLATFNIVIKYYNGKEKLQEIILPKGKDFYFATTKDQKWRPQNPTILNYKNYPNGEGLIEDIKLFSVVELFIPKNINFVEIPYTEQICNTILIINPEIEIKIRLKYNFNKEILSIKNKIILTYNKKLDFDKININTKV
jgi:hypothetical protein